MLDVKRIFSHDFCIKCLDFCGQFGNRWRLRILDKTAIGWGSRLRANYLIVSIALSAAITLTKKILEQFLEQEAEKMIAKKA